MLQKITQEEYIQKLQKSNKLFIGRFCGASLKFFMEHLERYNVKEYTEQYLKDHYSYRWTELETTENHLIFWRHDYIDPCMSTNCDQQYIGDKQEHNYYIDGNILYHERMENKYYPHLYINL